MKPQLPQPNQGNSHSFKLHMHTEVMSQLQNVGRFFFFLPSIKLPHGICCISGVFKFHKSKARGVPCHPDTAQWAIVAKGPFQLCLVAIVSQVPNVHLAVERAISVHVGLWQHKKSMRWLSCFLANISKSCPGFFLRLNKQFIWTGVGPKSPERADLV